MVPVTPSNAYEMREYVLSTVLHDAEGDSLKQAFLAYLDLVTTAPTQPPDDRLYLRCAINGLNGTKDKGEDLARLLGQSSFVDGTPMPWVGDIWSVLGIKWAVDHADDQAMTSKFIGWVSDFLPQRIKDGRLAAPEKAIAEYILANELTIASASCVVLFLHYKDILPIIDPDYKTKCLTEFFADFRDAYKLQHSPLILALFVYVFDAVNAETAALPPNLWGVQEIIKFLDNIPAGLRRWTWEETPRTKNSIAAKWLVENEYHVQNLLYALLGPIFPDVTDEMYAHPVGQKNPRLDLYLPSIDTVIEVKYRKDNKKTFQDLIGEVAEDASLYRADARFKKSHLIVFLWDHTRATQEHVKFKDGVMRIDGIDGCVVVSAPSVMG
jgi:hypothetical protein